MGRGRGWGPGAGRAQRAGLAAWVGLVGLVGCDSGDGPGPGAEDGEARTDGGGGGGGDLGPDAAPPRVLSAVTYNVGLARGFVPYADERVAPAVAAIAELDADVVCLQEVWEPGDLAAVTAATAERYPHRFSAPADPGVCGACGAEEAAGLEACVRERCPDDLEDPVGCALDACSEEVNSVSESCLVCLSANIGGSLDTLLQACAGESSACYAYGGSYGTVLLSKRPLVAPSVTTWSSSINRRGVLAARVAVDAAQDPVASGAEEAHVYCTHLSAIFSDIPYPGVGPDGDSQAAWAAEQRAQIEALRAQIEAEAGLGAGAAPTVLLGDFNTGPAVPATMVEAEFDANYTLLATELASPFVADPGTCTYCSLENPLIAGGQGGTAGVILDHGLVQGFEGSATLSARRLLDQTITLTTDDGPVETRLSDHYGVEVRVTASPR